jgi:hypothetical protein
MSSVPEEYYDFPDVFSKAKADKPADHRPYDLKIDLEEGAAPPLCPIYSLSQSEVQSLREFIDEHLNMGFIRPSLSPHGCKGNLGRGSTLKRRTGEVGTKVNIQN